MKRACHPLQAAPVETGLALHTGLASKERGALEGFGQEWQPTLHLDTVNGLNGSTGLSVP